MYVVLCPFGTESVLYNISSHEDELMFLLAVVIIRLSWD